MKLGRNLSLAFAAVVLVVVLAPLYGLYGQNQAINAYDTRVAGQVDSERATADIECEFNSQVHEWKNVLLRGSNPEQFDKHWQAFVKGERNVSKKPATLSASLPEGQSETPVCQFAQSHKQIGVAYLLGLDAFKAAKQIETLINTSVVHVEQETSQVDHAGNSMHEAVSAVQRVTDMATQIASESQEQAATVGQIGYIVTGMSHTTQQYAALVEEMAAAAERLKAQANEQVHTVAVFALGSDQTGLVWRSAV